MASVRLPATHFLEGCLKTRRYPKYTIKPLISREDALRKLQQEAIDRLFKGSIINVCQAFFSEKKVSKKELEEMRKLIDSFDAEE